MDSTDVRVMRPDTSVDSEHHAQKILSAVEEVSVTAARDDDASNMTDTIHHRGTQSLSEDADGQRQRTLVSRGPPDGVEGEEEEEDARPALQLFVPSHRKLLPISGACLKTVLLKYLLFLLNFCFWSDVLKICLPF
ncbi:hypothetical protein ACOMHN_049249 [Nucella lapillus]